MSAWTRLVEWLVADKRLTGLTDDECRAVIESLVICAEADGIITTDEWVKLHLEIKKLPWAWHHPSDEVDRIIAAFRRKKQQDRKIGIMMADEVREIVARFPTDEKMRRRIYRMQVSVCWFDGKAHDEHDDQLHAFREAMGISEKDAKRILQSVRDETIPGLG